MENILLFCEFIISIVENESLVPNGGFFTDMDNAVIHASITAEVSSFHSKGGCDGEFGCYE